MRDSRAKARQTSALIKKGEKEKLLQALFLP